MVLKYLVFVLTFGLSFGVNAQFLHDEVYRVEGAQASTGGRIYSVGILILSRDSTFVIQSQQYLSRKMRRKHVIWDLIEESGSWSRASPSKIECKILKSDRETEGRTYYLLKKSKNKVYFYSDLETFGKYKTSPWKRIKIY